MPLQQGATVRSIAHETAPPRRYDEIADDSTSALTYEFALVVHAPRAVEVPRALLSLARKHRDLQVLVVSQGDVHAESMPTYNLVERITDAGVETVADAWNLGLARVRSRWVRFARLSEAESLALPRRLRLPPGESVAAMIESTHDGIITQRNFESIFLAPQAIWFDRCTLLQSNVRFEGSVRRSFAPRCVLLSILAARPDLSLRLLSHREPRAKKTGQDDDEWRDPAIYDEGIRNGYLAPIESAMAARGEVPRWLARAILKDLMQYFVLDTRAPSPTMVVDNEQMQHFHRLVGQVLGHIDATMIAELEVSDEFRGALLSYKKLALAPQPRIRQVDDSDSSVLVEYLFAGALPREATKRADTVLKSTCTKTQAFRFFDRTLLWRRFVWIEATVGDTLTLELDGVRHLLKVEPPKKRTRRSWRSTVLEWIAALPPIRRRFTSAWALSDRWETADDNGEHLYRWIRANHPDINAWFVLEKRSPDWSRLAADGFRLVSSRLGMRLLYLNSEHVVSSQPSMLGSALLIQEQRAELKPKRTYLRHGVLCTDQANWFNEQRFDLIVVSNAREHATMVEDNSPYGYTSRHVCLTGLARHDRLVALRDRFPANQRDYVVIMPTWRASLQHAESSSAGAASIGETDYVKNWRKLLHNERLRDALSANGKELVFFPHPNLVPYLDLFDVPSWVHTATKPTTSFQQVFLRASILVTDYSSVAFEMAILRRPVLYFQFDRDVFYLGEHNWRQAEHFDFERDGFGPIVTTAEDAVLEIEEMLCRQGDAEPKYLERMKAAAPLDDALACERTFEAIRGLGKGPLSDRLLQNCAKFEKIDT